MKRALIFIIWLSPFLGYAQTINNGLVGYWPFNNNANDESGNNNNGILMNGITPAQDRFGSENSAFEFDGIDDYIQINHDQSLNFDNDFSICFWLNAGDSHNFHRIITKYDNGNGWIVFGNSSNEIIANISQTYNIPVGTYEINNWTFYAIVKSSDELYTYKNGNLISSQVVQSDNLNTTVDLTFGKCLNCAVLNQFLKGKLDDIRIYNREITEEEILTLYYLTPGNDFCESIFCDGENVGIGTENTHGYKLAVAGSVIAENIKIDYQDNWPDYVFDENYNMDIEQLKFFIEKYKHLPNIPSAEIIERNGYELGEMDKRLLEKIEELTLILIDQNKEIQSLTNQIEELKNE